MWWWSLVHWGGCVVDGSLIWLLLLSKPWPVKHTVYTIPPLFQNGATSVFETCFARMVRIQHKGERCYNVLLAFKVIIILFGLNWFRIQHAEV